MLVLTRKSGQKLIINDNIEIIILETRGDAVKIGINAPKNVTIYREEIYEEIKKSNQQASKNVLVSDLNSVMNIMGNKVKPQVSYLDKFKTLTTSTENKAQNKSNNE